MSNEKEKGTPTDQTTEAFGFFGLNSQGGIDAAKKRYRELAINYHPDKGGNLDLMQKLNGYYQMISNYYKENNSVGKDTEQVIFQETDSFNALFTQFADDAPFEAPKETYFQQNYQRSAWNAESPEPSHFSSTDQNNESDDEYQIRMCQAAIQSKLIQMNGISTLAPVISFIFKSQKATAEHIARAQTILESKKSLDEIKTILLLAAHIAQPAMQVPVHYSLSIAEALAASSHREDMLKKAKYCEHFLFDKFTLFINPSEKTIDYERNELFISLFSKMFHVLNEVGSSGAVDEKKMLFEQAYAKASDFIPHSLANNKDVVFLEIGKIFSLIFHDTMSIDDRLDMLNVCYTIISPNYYKTKYEVHEKIQSIFNYFTERGFSVEKTKQALQGIGYIQDKKTKISSLRHPKKLFEFYERLEKITKTESHDVENDAVQSQICEFIFSVKVGSRGYIDGRDEPAMNEWIDAFETGFETFQQSSPLFNESMKAFREFSLPPGNKAFLSPFESIYVPVLSVVNSACTLIAFLNAKHGDEVYEKKEDIKKLRLLMHDFQQNRHFDIQKKKDYISLTEQQRSLYQFLNSIQRRQKKRGMFLPDDIGKIIELCF